MVSIFVGKHEGIRICRGILAENFLALIPLVTASNAVFLDPEYYDFFLILRLVCHVTKTWMDDHLIEHGSSRQEDSWRCADRDWLIAGKMNVLLYTLAVEFGMPSDTKRFFRKEFIRTWMWGLSGEPEPWTGPCYTGSQRAVKLALAEDKCELAEFVYRNVPTDDRALCDPIVRTMQLELGWSDESSVMEL